LVYIKEHLIYSNYAPKEKKNHSMGQMLPIISSDPNNILPYYQTVGIMGDRSIVKRFIPEVPSRMNIDFLGGSKVIEPAKF